MGFECKINEYGGRDYEWVSLQERFFLCKYFGLIRH